MTLCSDALNTWKNSPAGCRQPGMLQAARYALHGR